MGLTERTFSPVAFLRTWALVMTLLWSIPYDLFGGVEDLSGVRQELEQELARLLRLSDAGSDELSTFLKLSGVYLDLGYGLYADPSKKMATFREGARWAKRALEISEFSAEAHFLYAANLGSGAELEGLFSSALTLQEIKRHVKRVLELDRTFAPAHHMLGRMYEDLPWFLGGDQKAAGEHLKQAVALDTSYAPARLDLAKWLLKQGRPDEARKELTAIIDQPPLNKVWLWVTRYKPEAMALLQQIGGDEKPVP